MSLKVMVIGATGLLGGQVVERLLAAGDDVTALVRSPQAALDMDRKGVRTVHGDLKDSGSLVRALAPGFDALVTTAYGYARRQKGDSLRTVDDEGNRNLIAAARISGIGRFVFTSILTAEHAVSVPHFHQKARTEDVLERSGLNWVSLRPGGFLDTLLGWNAAAIAKGRLTVPANLDAPASTILSADVATYLAEAVRHPGLSAERIDIGTSRPTTLREIASLLSRELGREITPANPPALVMTAMRLVARLSGGSFADTLKSMDYVSSGRYVADVTRQTAVFGPPPSIEDSVGRWSAAHRASQ